VEVTQKGRWVYDDTASGNALQRLDALQEKPAGGGSTVVQARTRLSEQIGELLVGFMSRGRETYGLIALAIGVVASLVLRK